ncbi:hypothetical protein JXB31_02995 [Candidatus Woesearchaeota archaeon]|nr:hypothetical protein [Candidatus Woesearchaeota archaeon]
MKEVELLKDWIIENLKYRDVYMKSINDILQGKDESEVIVSYKNKRQLVLIEPYFSAMDSLIGRIKDCQQDFDSVLVVTLNSKANVSGLIECWGRLVSIHILTIYFVNPYSEKEKRWIITPYSHDMVAHRQSLKSGLMSLYSNVDEYQKKNSV